MHPLTPSTFLPYILIACGIVLGVLLGFYAGYDIGFERGASAKTQSPISDDMNFCTMDALLCPDGSYVGRVGPSCEFAPCPSM